MDINELISIFGNNCFPIIMCAMLYQTMTTQMKNHQSETKEVIKALDKNTKAIEVLTLKFEIKKELDDE